MPRQPRVFVEGGLYHVYNRTSHGAAVLSEGDGGHELARLLSRGLTADGHLVYAWVVMSNHYHVVLRSSAVTLARTFGRIQSGFGRFRNRIVGSMGPTWQSRYKAKLVEDERYLMQLIAYVHLNPVEAGLVDDPADHELSGHRELIGVADLGLLARDEVLSMYGESEAKALRSYLSALAAAQDEEVDWLQARPGRLPWWRHEADRPLEPPPLAAWTEPDGRPSREPRPRLDAQEFVEVACAELGVSPTQLEERSRRPELTDLRFLVVGLGIERWGQRAARLAEILGRRADYVTWWARRARELRLSDSSWTERYEALDDKLRRRYEEAPRDQTPQ